ncbi:hypothetical protein V6M85_11215 [Sulfolobus tengchongensis]|uniref:Uncharacterized protein n=1 Tax=Sulfolobus tengchongensis TaxID=207809 RepID=A0AAX4L0C3_9CREN
MTYGFGCTNSSVPVCPIGTLGLPANATFTQPPPWYISYLPEILIGIAGIGLVSFFVLRGRFKFLPRKKGKEVKF